MNNQVHEESLMMEKFTSQDQQQQQRLKCPRCESWNTKFCYYNNYSLSQPRHFCKGCKRYWTSGGTLRNVPVGGGCRKINKRIKKPSTTSSTSTNHSSTLTPSISTTNTNPSHHIHQAQNDTISPLLYGLLPTYPSNLKFPFPRLFNNSEICNIDTISGLGFVQDFGTANSSSLSSSNSICGSSTLASLIASNPQQHNFRGLISSYEDLEIPGKNVHSGNGMMSIKMEGDGQNRLVWNLSNHEKIPMEQLNSSDPSLSWTGANLFDPSHMGSSVPSLI